MEIYKDPPIGLYNDNFDLWFRSFRDFIFTVIVPRILPNNNENRNEYAKIMISDEAMKIWVVAYTDLTYDPNKDSNYELLELLGDRILGATFSNFAIKRFPDITEEILTEVNATYMSKVKQKDMAKKLGLDKWVRTNMSITIHTSEDVFESTFGALYKIGDLYIGKGNGYALCTNFVTNLYHDLTIDLNTILSRPKTQVKEIFEKLNWGRYPDIKFNLKELGEIKELGVTGKDNYNIYELTLRLTDTAMDFLKSRGKFDGKGPILSQINGKDKKNVEIKAYSMALQSLKSRFGIDYEWAENESKERFREEYESYAKDRMKEDNITNLQFSKNKKTGDIQFIQLIGLNNEGRKEILLSIQGPFNATIINLKKFAINQYVQYGKISSSQIIEYTE